MMKKQLIAMTIAVAAASILSNAAHAGISVEYLISNETTSEKHAPRGGSAKSTFQIDGQRFQIQNARGITETSLDDGANVYFGEDRSNTQSPLKPESGCWGSGNLGPISGSLQDEKITISEPRNGPALFGAATRIYRIDHQYKITARFACITFRQTQVNAHYDLTIADLNTSAAAIRVALSRGHGYALSRHAEFFPGLPLRIEGRVESAIDENSRQVTHFCMEAISLSPWSWPALQAAE